ncbi:catalase family peroxidase [Janthinobacterium agaricidamnosum]|uniref:Catalase-related peroxidase n=1 Tax=Janthinobacterium agaricidamnosum NBRC 102515 = DSM 9628 TaxID=1349767 RepID=W0V192_9BURK|nr:catalase family peroxidase [Janthinobacterium agaricidamnosum]CDG81103.1 catalase family protein [Janthinobacterium agaricidamnosum NBRC 102515 = DSM 9628]
MNATLLRGLAAVATTTAMLAGAHAQSAAPGPVEQVDALNHVFGQHAGQRASHAKGFCAAGAFTPDRQAASLVHGPLFEQAKVPALLRFSIGGGNPAASDKSRSVRGLALRLSGGDETYDLVLISEPVFFAATPASFVSFLDARVADPATRQPDPKKIAEHNARYPDGRTQPALLAAHAAPASYASTPYFSNNAFVFSNAAGKKQYARIVVEPDAGVHYLSADEEKSQPDLFLEGELKNRLAKAPAGFTLFAQLPAAGDSLIDPSRQWSGSQRIALGKLTVSTLADNGTCDPVVFMPLQLPTGIAGSDDPILQARGGAYAVSLSRRLRK